MASRFGRNKRRQARQKIAELELWNVHLSRHLERAQQASMQAQQRYERAEMHAFSRWCARHGLLLDMIDRIKDAVAAQYSKQVFEQMMNAGMETVLRKVTPKLAVSSDHEPSTMMDIVHVSLVIPEVRLNLSRMVRAQNEVDS